MKHRRPSTFAWLAALHLLAASSAAMANDTARYATEGVTIRLVAETPDQSGRMRGAVLFDLEPGWKTYWLDPGESGLAPMFDFGASQRLSPPELTFPAPARLMEGVSSFNGYDEPMAVAFETTALDADPRLDLSLAVGICREICVPVTARLSRDVASPLSLEDATAIDRAFLALPDDGDATIARLDGEELVLAAGPEDASDGDLFVSGQGGWSFGKAWVENGDWRVPVRSRPQDDGALTSLDAVLVLGDGARRFDIDIR